MSIWKDVVTELGSTNSPGDNHENLDKRLGQDSKRRLPEYKSELWPEPNCSVIRASDKVGVLVHKCRPIWNVLDNI
jgi:hypothetical protein